MNILKQLAFVAIWSIGWVISSAMFEEMADDALDMGFPFVVHVSFGYRLLVYIVLPSALVTCSYLALFVAPRLSGLLASIFVALAIDYCVLVYALPMRMAIVLEQFKALHPGAAPNLNLDARSLALVAAANGVCLLFYLGFNHLRNRWLHAPRGERVR